ncbi:DNA polymerase III subunit psi [Vibrio sp. VB16]|uniref:DNA polymerase III subunit psi n=1 Tax=Vibrio sp. VB16 TaxID=2785746 RepID=UPI00189D6026|nr:DNA polymerase III subunit psi [Vibrio sp. VB16]UGA54244.1 DNA polymerase III subunit psi [Vibrio sp. VB16]
MQYLEEMDIQNWVLLHPSRLSGCPIENVDIPESCRLLLVSPEKPEGDIVVMLEKVLKSMKLELSQAMHIFPEQFNYLGSHHLKWVWFAGCDKTGIPNLNTLVSPVLTKIDGNNQERRNLWQNICSYDK